MKIERITPFLVDRCLLVRVYTDEGIVGTGEAGLWAHHELVYEAIEQLSEYYVGKDASRIEHHFQVVSRDTHFQGAVLSAAHERHRHRALGHPRQVARQAGLPVARRQAARQGQGVRQRRRRHPGRARPAGARSSSSRATSRCGRMPFFDGFEQRPPSQAITDAVEIVRVIREAVGYGIDLGVEIHRNFSKAEVVVFGNAVLPYRLLYLEDPLAPESTESLQVRRRARQRADRGRRALVQPVPVQGDHRHRRGQL